MTQVHDLLISRNTTGVMGSELALSFGDTEFIPTPQNNNNPDHSRP